MVRAKIFDRLDRRLERFICNFDLGSDPPAPDPNIGIAAKESADVGQQSVELGKEQLAYQQEQAAWQKDEAQKVIDQQLAIGNDNQQHANDQWGYYKSTFQPVEEQMVQQAQNYATPEEQDRQAGAAVADVNTQFANAKAQNDRAMEGMGVNPNSGKFAALGREAAVQQGAAAAGAANNARLNVRNQGWARLQDVSNFGRNMPSTSSTQYNIATQAGNSAVGNANSTANSINSGYDAARGWYGTGASAIGQSGNILNSQYGNQISSFNAGLKSNEQNLETAGSVLGFMMSSKTFKENKKPIDAKAALKGIKGLAIEKWNYKPDANPDGADHVGPYAEDFKKTFGLGDGKVISNIDAHGVAMAAIKGLSQQVDQLQKKIPAAKGIRKGAK